MQIQDLSPDMRKEEILAAIAAASDAYPALKELKSELPKTQLVKEAQRIVAEAAPAPLTDEEKAAAFDALVEKRPEARLLPVGQGVLRLRGKAPGQLFELSVFAEGPGMKILDSPGVLSRKWRSPEDYRRPEPEKPRSVSVQDVPKWARALVYDAIISGQIGVYPSEADIPASAAHRTTMLDITTGEVGLRYVYAGGPAYGDVEESARPVLVEVRGEFTRAEQEAAWNVLNARVDGDAPLPSSPDAVAADPKDVSAAEVDHVRARILRCLERPDRFTTKTVGAFEERVFFDQLLSCELAGYTPQRTSAGPKNGGFRPNVYRMIRDVARERGFDVLGDYVRPQQPREIKEDLAPLGPGFVHMDSWRKEPQLR